MVLKDDNIVPKMQVYSVMVHVWTPPEEMVEEITAMGDFRKKRARDRDFTIRITEITNGGEIVFLFNKQIESKPELDEPYEGNVTDLILNATDIYLEHWVSDDLPPEEIDLRKQTKVSFFNGILLKLQVEFEDPTKVSSS